jgi:hypothetical protein
MDVKNIRVPAGQNVLRIPFSINVKEIDGEALDRLLDVVKEKLGATHFRDKGLFLEVLKDRREATQVWGAYFDGPYLGVFLRPGGDLGIAATKNSFEGGTTYSSEQLFALARRLTPDDVDKAFQLSQECLRGIERAKEMVAHTGQRWEEITLISDRDRFLEMRRLYGIPSAVSEMEDPSPFNKSGSIFINDDTGLFVAYAPSSARAPTSTPAEPAHRSFG